MSNSLENCKIMNCIALSIILNYLICIIKLWMSFVLKHRQICKIVLTNTRCCTMFYCYSHVCSNHVNNKYICSTFLKVNGFPVK